MQPKGDNNVLFAVSVIVGMLTLVIMYLQYKDNKELKAIEKELKLHELDNIKHNTL